MEKMGIVNENKKSMERDKISDMTIQKNRGTAKHVNVRRSIWEYIYIYIQFKSHKTWVEKHITTLLNYM